MELTNDFVNLIFPANGSVDNPKRKKPATNKFRSRLSLQTVLSLERRPSEAFCDEFQTQNASKLKGCQTRRATNGGQQNMAEPIHVVRHDGQWAWRREHSERVSRITDTQGEAIDQARSAAQRDGVELFIHGRDGKIRDRDSHGHDPCPPPG
jgi:LAS superfamily LD-carboxypeptidase LdcB